MRIALYVRPFAPMLGGLESISEMLAHAFTSAGHVVTVFTETAVVQEPCRDASFKIVRRMPAHSLLRGFRESDVILFMGMSLRALPCALLSGTPIVVSHHGVYGGDTIISRLCAAIKRSCTVCFQNICVSHFVADHIPVRSVVVHNAYDHDVFKASHAVKRDHTLVFCGRLAPDKGAALLIEALRLVRALRPEVDLTVIGDGAERPGLEARVRDLEMEAHVSFTGWLRGEALARLMERHRIMVAPSICEEGFGIVALEGLACGCRLIVTNRGGLPEAAGVWGRLCAPDAQAIASAIIAELDISEAENTLALADLAEYLLDHQRDRVAERYLRVLARTAGHRLREVAA
jgi:glycogen synthase